MNSTILISFIIILTNKLIISGNMESVCCLSSSKYLQKSEFSDTFLTDFTSTKELNFDSCNDTYYFNNLIIKSLKRILFEIYIQKPFYINLTESNDFYLILDNFKGFSMETNLYQQVRFRNYDIPMLLILRNSKFEFFYMNQSVDNNCGENLLIPARKNYFLTSIHTLLLNQNIKFPEYTCPLAFSQSYIYTIIFRSSNGLFEKNQLSFKQINSTVQNSFIFQVIAQVYHVDVNSKFLDTNVFKFLQALDLCGEINQIQDDIFQLLKKIRLIRFQSQKVENLFKKRNNWLAKINYHQTRLNLGTSVIVMFIQRYKHFRYYEYPNEDFCFFKNFPHDKFVLPLLTPVLDTDLCSCTQMFLLQNSIKYAQDIIYLMDGLNTYYDLNQYYNVKIENQTVFDLIGNCREVPFDEFIAKCNFTKRIEICNINEAKTDNSLFYFYISDFGYSVKYVYIIFVFLINPMFCVYEFFLNALIIIVLSKEKAQKNKSKTYIYLRLSSYVNLFFVSFMFIKLVFNCEYDTLFCWSFPKTTNGFYFFILLIKFIPNVLKTCSNVLNIYYSLSRYVECTSKANLFLVKMMHLPTYSVIGMTLIFSILLNIYIVFEFKHISIGKESLQGNNPDTRFIYGYERVVYSEETTDTRSSIFKILHFMRIIISDVVYVLIISVIDLLLFRFIRIQSKIKQKLTSSSKSAAKKHFLTYKQIRDKLKKLRKTKSVENRITGMIILNNLNFIIFRLPLIVLSFYNFFFRLNFNTMKYEPSIFAYILCRYFNLCDTLSEISFSIYLNSFSIQFLIFYRLDNNFKENLNILINGLKKKIFQNLFKVK